MIASNSAQKRSEREAGTVAVPIRTSGAVCHEGLLGSEGTAPLFLKLGQFQTAA